MSDLVFAQRLTRAGRQIHPGGCSRVGTQDLLDPGCLPCQLGHGSLVLGDLAPALDVLARRRLESLDKKVPHGTVKDVAPDLEVVPVPVDDNAGHILELRSLGERERVGEHG